MIGNWKWNLFFGLGGMLLAFLWSWHNNPFSTAWIRSVYCFVILFLMMYPIRFFLGTIIGIGANNDDADDHLEEDQKKGSYVDLSTPDDEPLDQLLHTKTEPEASELKQKPSAPVQSSEAFKPIQPPRLATKEPVSPDKMANAVRNLSEREGR